MTVTYPFLAIAGTVPVTVVAGIAIAAFVIGLLSKRGVIAKSKKRVLKLENEMLSNHSRILSLEQKITDLEGENKELRDRLGNIKPELKVS